MPLTQEYFRTVIDAAISYRDYVQAIQKHIDSLIDDGIPRDGVTALSILRSIMAESAPNLTHVYAIAGADKQFSPANMKRNQKNLLRKRRERFNKIQHEADVAQAVREVDKEHLAKSTADHTSRLEQARAEVDANPEQKPQEDYPATFRATMGDAKPAAMARAYPHWLKEQEQLMKLKSFNFGGTT